MTDSEKLVHLKLSLQRALLGSVAENLVGITAGFKAPDIVILGYYTSPVTTQEEEDISSIGSEVTGDFEGEIQVETKALSANDGLNMLEFWAFLKRKH